MDGNVIQDEDSGTKVAVEKSILVVTIAMIFYGAFYGFFSLVITATALSYLETWPGLGYFGLIFTVIMLLVTLFYLLGAYGLWKKINYPWKVVMNILIVIAIPMSLYLSAGFQNGQFNPIFFILGMTTPVNLIMAGFLFKSREKFK